MTTKTPESQKGWFHYCFIADFQATAQGLTELMGAHMSMPYVQCGWDPVVCRPYSREMSCTMEYAKGLWHGPSHHVFGGAGYFIKDLAGVRGQAVPCSSCSPGQHLLTACLSPTLASALGQSCLGLGTRDMGALSPSRPALSGAGRTELTSSCPQLFTP